MNTKQLVLIVLVSSTLSIVVSQLLLTAFSPVTPKDGSPTLNTTTQALTQTLVKQQAQIDELKNALTSMRKLNSDPLSGRSTSEADDSGTQRSQDEEETQITSEPNIEVQRPVTTPGQIRRRMLEDNGFASDEVTWILRNEMEVQLDALYEQHRARRAQVELEQANGTRAKSRSEQLRERLGDDYYERYLEANGFPTTVGVSSVLTNSPGANAGLQAGDRIVAYDGNRVFNIRDLNGLTVLGQAGETVLIEVEREGNPVQLSLPRGPIGITGGRGRF